MIQLWQMKSKSFFLSRSCENYSIITTIVLISIDDGWLVSLHSRRRCLFQQSNSRSDAAWAEHKCQIIMLWPARWFMTTVNDLETRRFSLSSITSHREQPHDAKYAKIYFCLFVLFDSHPHPRSQCRETWQKNLHNFAENKSKIEDFENKSFASCWVD